MLQGEHGIVHSGDPGYRDTPTHGQCGHFDFRWETKVRSWAVWASGFNCQARVNESRSSGWATKTPDGSKTEALGSKDEDEKSR